MGADTRKKILFTQDFEDAIAPDGIDQAYISGNIRENKDHSQTADKLNETYNATGNIPTTYEYRVGAPLFPSYATIHSAQDAMKIVTSYAGATMPMRDEQHVRNVRETLEGSYTYVGSKSKIKGEIDTEADITEHAQGNGWETYPEEQRAADWDTDQDGMPDWWEKTIGSDPNTANQNEDADGDGWTALEDYLEFMAHPYVMLKANGEATMDLKPYFAGFYGQNGNAVTPTYSLEILPNGIYSADIEGSLLKVKATKPDAKGVFDFNVTVSDSETTFTQRFGLAITDVSTAISAVSTDDAAEVVRREFFTLDGRRVNQVKPYVTYVMQVTDAQGNTRSVKVIGNASR
jgi:hypothetical protein